MLNEVKVMINNNAEEIKNLMEGFEYLQQFLQDENIHEEMRNALSKMYESAEKIKDNNEYIRYHL